MVHHSKKTQPAKKKKKNTQLKYFAKNFHVTHTPLVADVFSPSPDVIQEFSKSHTA